MVESVYIMEYTDWLKVYIVEYTDWWKPKDDIIILPTTLSTTLAQPSSSNASKVSQEETAKDSVLITILFLINIFCIICVIFISNLKIFDYPIIFY